MGPRLSRPRAGGLWTKAMEKQLGESGGMHGVFTPGSSTDGGEGRTWEGMQAQTRFHPSEWHVLTVTRATIWNAGLSPSGPFWRSWGGVVRAWLGSRRGRRGLARGRRGGHWAEHQARARRQLWVEEGGLYSGNNLSAAVLQVNLSPGEVTCAHRGGQRTCAPPGGQVGECRHPVLVRGGGQSFSF